MEENWININGEQFENHLKEFNILKNENLQLRKEVEKNKDNIENLNLQLIKLKKELSEIEEKYNEQFKHLLDVIMKNEEKNKEKNEIIINEHNNIKVKKNEKIPDKKSTKSLNIENKKDNLFNMVITKGNGLKKGEKIDLSELFETKLFEIFNDKYQKIELNLKNDIKKIFTFILIQEINPTELFENFAEKNLNNKNQDELKDNKDIVIGQKKYEIFSISDELEKFKLITKVDKNKTDEFMKELREKCGITEEDMNNNDLKKAIKNNKFDKKKILGSILTKIFSKKG